jgi:hypothetical protein
MGRGPSKPKFCTICEDRHHAKGLCHAHYNQQYPKVYMGRRPSARVNYVVKQDKIDYEDYWLWVKKELNIV